MADQILISISKDLGPKDDLHYVSQVLLDALAEKGYTLNVINSPKTLKLPEGAKAGTFSKSKAYVLVGMNFSQMSEMFNILDVETHLTKSQKQGKLITVDLPGMNIADEINPLLMDYMDRRLISPTVFDILHGAWNTQDILDMLTIFCS